jgi:single-strand selective monofunctional uracil DNA glycosylase
MDMETITARLVGNVSGLIFSSPVSHVYNPLVYAHAPHALYLKRYGRPPREVLFLGMNPGPWGMAQTGVPFGEISAVREWMGIDAPVAVPFVEHPQRPIHGFSCRRTEVSGRRLWGWAKNRFETPERFFSRFFVANYCPLVFMEKGGKNRTPNILPKTESRPLFTACDQALRETVACFSPRFVIGIGAFAAERAAIALLGMKVTLGKITHPSPANPKANKDWEGLITAELKAMGVEL